MIDIQSGSSIKCNRPIDLSDSLTANDGAGGEVGGTGGTGGTDGTGVMGGGARGMRKGGVGKGEGTEGGS